MGNWTKSEYFLMMSLTRQTFRYSRSSSFKCSTISVPGCSRSPGSTVKLPLPADRLGARQHRAGADVDPRGHHEGGVESDAELADDLESRFLVLGRFRVCFHELERAR